MCHSFLSILISIFYNKVLLLLLFLKLDCFLQQVDLILSQTATGCLEDAI